MENNKCIERCKNSKVKIDDGNQKAIFINNERKVFLKSKVDQCLILNSVSCDWIISKEDEGSIVVEFKGRDIEHALIQVEAGMNFLSKSINLPKNRKAGLIVCAGVKKTPKFNSRLQKTKNSFAKKYQAPLHIVNGIYEYKFENVLSFDGPF